LPISANRNGYYDANGVNETHSGVELELNSKPLPKFNIDAMVSIGEWKYNGNATYNRFDVNNTQIGTGVLYLEKVKVGDAAQITASLGASYEVITRVTLDANYRVADKLYAAIEPGKFSNSVNDGSLELPSYGLMDAGFSYKMLVGKNKGDSVNFRFNVNNLLDEVYISESRTNNFTTPTSTNYNGVNVTNQVYFGFGRTWNFSLRYNF
ncbi:MAG: TonB-dependent receptor, partial [Flavobacterium sp.]|nr:TonB-dependent receptor [Flavobacterium sp.]